MTATAKTARTQTVYYIVVNGEQVAEAKRRPAADAKFAETVASDTTNRITLVTGTGKVLDERPAVEAETVNIPGIGKVTAKQLEQAKTAGAELKAAYDKLNEGDDEDPLAALADALGDADAEGDTEQVADLTADIVGVVADANPDAPVEQLVEQVKEVVADAKAAKKTAEPKVTTPTGDVKISTYADMIGIFTTAVAKNEMGSGSLAGYKAGVRAVLKAQTGGLETDLTTVDIEMAVAVFEAKTPGILTQTSKTYIADFRRAVTLYNLYLADPTNFKFPAKNVRATRLVPTAAPAPVAAPVAKKTAATPTAPKTSKKGKK